MTEMPNTEAQAKIALYAAMRRGTDPRWGAEPVEIAPSRPWILGTILPLGLIVGGVLLAGALILVATS
ncbi:MAG: hypothetical protein K0R61_37 [Microvirga sp.]|jgi:hypothetical protein|nr:hypothetical protein [Microvirga sp.]MDF2969587.1 hypothetical protein [Microvirga sp.]